MVTDAEFEALVTRFEGQARRNPANYKARVLLFALLGNAYLAAMLVLIAALLFAAIASVAVLKVFGLKLAFVVGVFLWMILKSLKVNIPPPQGMEVTKRDAPQFFAMIETLGRSLGAPRFHHVLMTDDFNAGVVQVPRLGAFGWYRNYLLIGLPLVKALSSEQFKSVLAHEFGHLAKGHGRLSNWIYRQRLRWSRLMATLDQVESRGSFLFKPFLRWYAPYFNAYSFPLARANEYEADAIAARLTSPHALAQALTAVNVIGSYLGERYWPQIHRQADEIPQPAFMPYAAMSERVAGEIDPASTRPWLDRALARKTTLADTHPSLADRLAALGQQAGLAPPAAGTAADRLLGEALERITQAFDRRWHENILPAWQKRHGEIQEGRRRLAELGRKLDSGAELTLPEAYERATLTESAGGDVDAAIEQFRALNARAPDDPVALFSLGARLLGRDDATGRALVERAMQGDEDFIVPGCESLRDYCWRTGSEEEAREWHRRLLERAALQEAAAKERSEVRLTDKFERHGLSTEALGRLQAQLKAIPGLRKAYFVRKLVRHLPERTSHVLGFTVGSVLHWHTKRRAADALERIRTAVEFPGATTIICVEGANYRFGRKFRWMRGSRIV